MSLEGFQSVLRDQHRALEGRNELVERIEAFVKEIVSKLRAILHNPPDLDGLNPGGSYDDRMAYFSAVNGALDAAGVSELRVLDSSDQGPGCSSFFPEPPLIGGAEIQNIVTQIWGGVGVLSLCVVDSPAFRAAREAQDHLWQFERVQLEQAVEAVTSADMKAAYLSGSGEDFGFIRRGSWTYVNREADQFGSFVTDVNPRSVLVLHDVKNPQLPSALTRLEGKLDFIFYIRDWSQHNDDKTDGDSDTHQLAVRLCKPGGIIVTASDSAAELLRCTDSESKRPAVSLLREYKYLQFSLLAKNPIKRGQREPSSERVDS